MLTLIDAVVGCEVLTTNTQKPKEKCIHTKIFIVFKWLVAILPLCMWWTWHLVILMLKFWRCQRHNQPSLLWWIDTVKFHHFASFRWQQQFNNFVKCAYVYMYSFVSTFFAILTSFHIHIKNVYYILTYKMKLVAFLIDNKLHCIR